MRKFLISLAAAGTALAFATPAAAQYYPQPQTYGYGAPQYAPQGYGYGYNNYGQVRALQMRIDAVQRQIEQFRARRLISRGEARDLRQESRQLEQRLYWAGRNGLNYNEARTVEYRIARLERHLAREARDGRGRYGYGNAYGNAYGNNAYGYADRDRDRDGRDDRYEDDHGNDRDD